MNQPCADPGACRASLLDVLGRSENPTANGVWAGCRKTLFQKSTTHQQAIANLENERNLSCHFWLAFTAMLEMVPEDFDSVFIAIREFMRKAILSGPPARTQPARVFGRATTREKLVAEMLVDGKAGTEDFAHDRISELDLPLDEIRTRWAFYPLGRWVTWATFNREGNRPFEGVKREASYIRGILGLPRSEDESTTPLLLIEYTLQGEIPHIPTVAEAYASQPWVSYFRPSGDLGYEAGYGYTHAREHYDMEPGRPEIVHKPVTGAALEHKPEEVS